jgi:predicted nucleotidyltransferase
MQREEIVGRLAGSRDLLARFGVKELYLFGSAARDEARDDSDVDLLVEFEQPVSLFQFVRLQRGIEAVLGCRVDLVTRRAIKPQLRDRILREAIRAA